MKISTIDIVPYRALLMRPLFTAHGVVRERLGFLLRLRASEGLEGWGEAGPIHWMEGDLSECERALRRLCALAGRDYKDLRERVTTLRRVHPEAACALDTALLDLDARYRGMNMADLLAKQPHGTCLAPRLSALLTQTTPKRIATEAATRAKAGYECLKIKVGIGPVRDDVERVAAVRETFAGEIRADANGGWSLDEAINACRNFERYNISWLEDPLPPPEDAFGRGLTSWRKLSGSTSIPLALDDRSEDEHTRELLTGVDAVDWIVLKLARTGGPSRAVSIAKGLVGSNARVAFTDSIETGVGQRAALHTAAAVAATQEAPAAVGLGGALTLVELKLDGDASCVTADSLRDAQPELPGPGLG